MHTPTVDAAVKYNCPYDGKIYIMLVRNSLNVPSMKNNLLPTFLLIEEVFKVQDTPKMQVSDLTVEDCSILFPVTSFRIPLSLWGKL